MREPQRHDRVDQALLGSVVQVAHDPPAFLVGGRHDPRPRRRQLGPGLDVRDRRRDQLGELPQARLGVRRQRPALRRRRDQDAPDPSVDDDRSADRGADFPRCAVVPDCAGGLRVVVDARGPLCLKHLRGDVLSLQGRREPTGNAAPGSPHCATTVTVASASYLAFSCLRRPGACPPPRRPLRRPPTAATRVPRASPRAAGRPAPPRGDSRRLAPRRLRSRVRSRPVRRSTRRPARASTACSTRATARSRPRR